MKWLKKVQKKKSFELPAAIAQIFVLKRRSKIDQDAIEDLERSARNMEDQADASALRCVIKLCVLSSGEFSRPLLGWLELRREDFKPATIAAALQHFEEALSDKRARSRSNINDALFTL